MKSLLLIILFVFGSTISFSQIGLNELYKGAMDNYPSAKLKGLYEQRTDRQLDILDFEYYPKVQFFGQISYQSSVPKLDIPLPILNFSMPEISKDQYRFGVNIDQTIWDGGIISSRKNIERMNLEIETNQTEVELFKIRRAIDEFVFGIELLSKQLKLYEYKLEILSEKQKLIHSAVSNGVMLSVNSDLITLEIITTENEQDLVIKDRNALIKSLNQICGTSYADDIDLSLPDVANFDSVLEYIRPEFSVFQSNRNKIDQLQELSHSIAMPKVSAYLQAGYFQPGYNMFDPEFETVYSLGLKMAWSPLNFSKVSDEKEQLHIGKQILSNKEAAFKESLSLESISIQNTFDRLNAEYENIVSVIKLRENIVRKTNARFENGTITFSEYIPELNALLSAKLMIEILKINIIKAKYKFMTHKGIEN